MRSADALGAPDFVHTGPGTAAGRYLREFWQPVYRAEDLPAGDAVPIQVMSEHFTLYRGETGTPHVTAFRCAHRGTQLSAGWVEGDDIRCRYHGWKYGAGGQCVEQPDEAVPFAKKVKIKAYPTVEYLGLIFVYFGESEAPKFRRFPAFEGAGVLKLGLPEVWPCNFFNRCENTVDTAHVNWTHRATRERLNLGKHMLHRIPTAATETDYGIEHIMTLSDGRTERIEFHMPNISHVRPTGRVEGSKGDETTITPDRLFCYVPIDDVNCTTFVVDYLPLTGAAAEAYRQRALQDRGRMATMSASDMGAAILAGKMSMRDLPADMSSYYSFWVEDYICLVGQGSIPDRPNERLGRTDIGPIMMRRLWQRELKALLEGAPIKRWT